MRRVSLVATAALVALSAAAPVWVAAAGAEPASTGSAGCDVAVSVSPLDRDRAALRFFTSHDSRRVSGTVALFAGNVHYDVRFRDAYALHIEFDENADVMPVVVRFAGPVRLQGAAVTALDGAPPCMPPFAPWLAERSPGVSAIAESVAAQARIAALPVHDVPAPEPYAPACAKPFAAPRVLRAVSPEMPPLAAEGGWSGVAYVALTLDASARVVEAHIAQSTGYRPLDDLAVSAARRSTFESAVFDCRKVGGRYTFGVSFNE